MVRVKNHKRSINQIWIGTGPGPSPEKFNYTGSGRVRAQESLIDRVRIRKFLDPTISNPPTIRYIFSLSKLLKRSYSSDDDLIETLAISNNNDRKWLSLTAHRTT
jgi:hypothetical protein